MMGLIREVVVLKRTLVIITGIISYFSILFLIFMNPGLINSTWGSLWFAFVSVMLSLMGALLAVTGAFLLIHKGEVVPYINKFSKYRFLLFQLVRRDFLAKYKRSFLGILWSFLNPLLTMLVMVLVFSFIFRSDIENFPVYVLSGQSIFMLFQESTTTAMNSVLGNASLIKKVAVPRYIFPISKAMSALINFVFSLAALLLVMVVTKEQLNFNMLAMALPILYVFLFSVGIGLILSAELVFFRDINYLYTLLVFTMSYFTPLFYPISIIPDHYRWVIFLNPLYHYVDCFRTVVLDGMFPSLAQHGICLLLSLAALIIGLVVFIRKQDDFILYI